MYFYDDHQLFNDVFLFINGDIFHIIQFRFLKLIKTFYKPENTNNIPPHLAKSMECLKIINDKEIVINFLTVVTKFNTKGPNLSIVKYINTYPTAPQKD